MHIGLITTGYPHCGDRVSGAFVREMACALVQRGHEITVLCAARADDTPVRDARITVHPVRYLPHFVRRGTFHDEGAPERLRRGDPAAWVGAFTFPIAALLAARASLATCDVLVSHFVLPCAIVAALVRHGRPHLAIAHGTDARWFARAPAPFQRAVLEGCTALRVTHDALRRALAPGVRDDPRVSVGPMGWRASATVGRAHERARLLRADRERVLALSVARAVSVKGLDVLVRAASELTDSVRVVIAGDGPERARLEAISPPNVTWVGAVDPTRRDALLAAADLFVVPSRAREGAPVALLEAMGVGLAVVASRTPGIEDLAGADARLVPADDARALAEAINDLATSAEARAELGARARRRVARWHWDVQALEIESLLVPAR